MIASKIFLFPYWLTLKIRHRLYDRGRLGTNSWMTPIISVGNLSAGGTGKTPMVEFILANLPGFCRPAVLSRGYRSKGKGFRPVNTDDDALFVGDEPLQIKRKFPRAIVACCRDRVKGVNSLLTLPEPPDVIILDDGFQRRDITPSNNILLIDYRRPLSGDNLLPLGRLRDLPEQIRRADTVVITKCPPYLSPEERSAAIAANRIPAGKRVYFATTVYDKPKAVFEGTGDNRYIYAKDVFCFTGIANPKPLTVRLIDDYENIVCRHFPDHHNFSRSDINSLWQYGRKHPLCLMLTTEKDSQRLLHNAFVPQQMKVRTFCIPIRTEFLTPAEHDSFIKSLRF